MMVHFIKCFCYVDSTHIHSIASIVLILCCHVFCYARMFGLAVLDLVFICNG